MKKQLIAAVLSALVIGTVSIGYGSERVQPPDPFLGQMTKVLDLSGDQQSQIKAILAEEREADADLMQQGAALRLQLRQAEWGTTFDENSVRATAVTLAQVEQELAVSRAKSHFQINQLLTSAQRTLAQKLQPEPGHQGMPPAFRP
jgi:Spy/CpxP family protein refolding chaperone